MKRSSARIYACICLGILTAVLVVFDGYLANICAKQLGVIIKGRNIWKLFPFEVTVLFLASIAPLYGIAALLRYCIVNSERSFIFLFLLGLQTTALTNMGRLDLSEFALIFFLLILLVRLLTQRRQATFTGLDALNLLFVAAVFLSAVNGGVLIFFSSSLTMVKFILILILVTNSIRTREDIAFTLKWFVILTTVSAVVAIAQEIIFMSTHIVIVGMVNKTALRLMFQETLGMRLLRVPAFFGSYKSFTFFLITALLILLNYYIYNRPFKFRDRAQLVVAAGVMLTALGLTFSNDAFLALFIGLLLSLLVWRPRYVVHVTLLGAAFVIVITALELWTKIGDALMHELRCGEQRVRVQLMRDGLTGVFHRNQLVGAGVTNAKKYTGHFFGWPVHNSIVESADDTGLFGLIVYLGLLAYPFFRLLRINFTIEDDRDRWIARALIFSFTSFFVSLQFHPFYLEKFNWLLIAIIQAFVLIMDRDRKMVERSKGLCSSGPEDVLQPKTA